MRRFTKTKPLSEIEQIKQQFPNYDRTPHRAEIDGNGNIIFIETDDVALQAILSARGFN